eukprot:TRINITY_DN10465_c0_g1_i1.p1 TRINITY_DN10465_c0_g1~~TRINITY_DN10465_c0_g1_i1.p1  ORF type:complete len:355 (+),score=14.97 TRINITY_DN10465_c0_g1_i1:78-1142(+)
MLHWLRVAAVCAVAAAASGTCGAKYDEVYNCGLVFTEADCNRSMEVRGLYDPRTECRWARGACVSFTCPAPPTPAPPTPAPPPPGVVDVSECPGGGVTAAGREGRVLCLFNSVDHFMGPGISRTVTVQPPPAHVCSITWVWLSVPDCYQWGKGGFLWRWTEPVTPPPYPACYGEHHPSGYCSPSFNMVWVTDEAGEVMSEQCGASFSKGRNVTRVAGNFTLHMEAHTKNGPSWAFKSSRELDAATEKSPREWNVPPFGEEYRGYAQGFEVTFTCEPEATDDGVHAAAIAAPTAVVGACCLAALGYVLHRHRHGARAVQAPAVLADDSGTGARVDENDESTSPQSADEDRTAPIL